MPDGFDDEIIIQKWLICHHNPDYKLPGKMDFLLIND